MRLENRCRHSPPPSLRSPPPPIHCHARVQAPPESPDPLPSPRKRQSLHYSLTLDWAFAFASMGVTTALPRLLPRGHLAFTLFRMHFSFSWLPVVLDVLVPVAVLVSLLRGVLSWPMHVRGSKDKEEGEADALV